MSMVILLDAGPLGLITNPRASQEARECNQWLESLVLKEIQVKIPEIADYEVRRELLRADKFKGIERLNSFLPDFRTKIPTIKRWTWMQ